MSVIQFQNGTKVNFEGNPSPQDIDYVAGTMNTSAQTSPQSQDPSFLQQAGDFTKKAIQNTLSGPVSMAARPGQLLGTAIAGGVSKLTGNPNYYNNAMDAANAPQHVPGTGTTIKGIGDETAESIGGEAASTVGLGIPSPVAGGAVLGMGSAMQDKQGPLGVGLGGLIGAAVGGGSQLLAKGLGQAFKPAEDTITKSLTATGASNDIEAPAISQVLRDTGLTDLTDTTQVAVTKNIIDNAIDSLQQTVASAEPDTVSGELSQSAQAALRHLNLLQSAKSALGQALSVPQASVEPGLMSKVASGVGHAALNTIKYPFQHPELAAAGLYGLYRKLGGEPLIGSI